MAKRLRTIITPLVATTDLTAADAPLTYWKQIVPEDSIQYEGKTINFDREYLTDLVDTFHTQRATGGKQVTFQLANPLNSHGRDMDPERQRAVIEDMRLAEAGEKPGAYAKMRFFSKKAARVVRNIPDLGVSARIRENTPDQHGNIVKRALIHVLGTIDPRVTGMSPWQPALDMSGADSGLVLDLSNAEYQGEAMAKGKSGTATIDAPDIETVTADDIAKFSDDELAAFLAAYDGVADDADSDDDDDADSDSGDSDDEPDDDPDDDEDTDTDDDGDTEGTTSMSAAQRRSLDFANSQAAEANARATEALKRMAAAEWAKERAELADDGVPPAMLDLAMPVLNRPDSFEVDLSNEGGPAALDVSEIVRGLLNEMRGTIDMSNESGHGGRDANEDAEDDRALDEWERQFPSGALTAKGR